MRVACGWVEPRTMAAMDLPAPQLLAAEELLDGAFLRLDSGDPDGALACALQALQVSGSADLAAAGSRAAQRASAAQVFDEIMRRGGIVADRGRGAVLRTALLDGSSVVCVRCAAVVSHQRMEAHMTKWCSMIAEDPCRGPEQPAQNMTGVVSDFMMDID
mmetsp:Transcript_23471/g.38510  ORF Transcript_23471/g.38510 Transcript_23471/m.38510 type:complete len:160 (+) Transcript_23471:2-481(+)